MEHLARRFVHIKNEDEFRPLHPEARDVFTAVQDLAELIAKDPKAAFARIERMVGDGNEARIKKVPVGIGRFDAQITFALNVSSQALAAFINFDGNDPQRGLEVANRLSPGENFEPRTTFRLDIAVDLQTDHLLLRMKNEGGIYDLATHRNLDSQIRPLNPTIFAAFALSLEDVKKSWIAPVKVGKATGPIYSRSGRRMDVDVEDFAQRQKPKSRPTDSDDDLSYLRPREVSYYNPRTGERITQIFPPAQRVVFGATIPQAFAQEPDVPKRKPWKKGDPGNPPREKVKPPGANLDVIKSAEGTHREQRLPLEAPVKLPSSEMTSEEFLRRTWNSLGERAFSYEEVQPVEPKPEKKQRKPKGNKGPGRHSGRTINKNTVVPWWLR